jgi:hypothetical protein
MRDGSLKRGTTWSYVVNVRLRARHDNTGTRRELTVPGLRVNGTTGAELQAQGGFRSPLTVLL